MGNGRLLSQIRSEGRDLDTHDRSSGVIEQRTRIPTSNSLPGAPGAGFAPGRLEFSSVFFLHHLSQDFPLSRPPDPHSRISTFKPL